MAAPGQAVPGTAVPGGSLATPGGAQGTQGIQGPTGSVPTGVILDFAGASAPTGFLLCDGTSYPTATYAALFAVIGYTFGGSGANFNVPDLRSRVSVGAGQGSGLSNRALTATGGEETHQLTIAELAVHTHVQNAHTHSLPDGVTGSITVTAGPYNVSTISPTTSGSTTATNQNTGSGTAHNTMPPFLVLQKIVKT